MTIKKPFFRFLLLPVASLYYFVIWFRNLLFEWKLLPSKNFGIPVICIGNIAVGGTGKTPFTEYLVSLLCKQYRVAILSRGYKRETKGFVLVDTHKAAWEVGDEACQFKHKFPEISVAVDENRRRGIEHLLSLPEKERPQVILLDDAMQHRYVTPSLTIMLTEYHHMYYEDYILPVGRLRESTKGVYRADIVVVTKCKDIIKPIDLRIIEKNMMLMANQNLYFSKIKYHTLEPLFPSQALHSCSLNDLKADEDLLLITGIANPQLFVDKIKSLNPKVHIFTFNDHHSFTMTDIETIDAGFKSMSSLQKRIITTEKDAMRLKNLVFLPEKWKPFLFYLPISVEFLFDQGEIFNSRIRTHIVSTININKKNVRN